MTLGDRVVVMNEGVVLQCASPLEVYNQPANRFVAGFLGMPPMNFFEGQIERRESGIVFTCDAGKLPVDGRAGELLDDAKSRAVVAGVRPEAYLIESSETKSGLAAIVNVVEPLGSMIDVYLQLENEQTIVCRVPAKSQAEGVAVRAMVSPRDVYLFDPGEAGQNLFPPSTLSQDAVGKVVSP